MEQRNQETKPIVFFDIESTGVDVANDRIITLYAVKLDGLPPAIPLGTLDIKVNPGRPIPSQATKIHGIKDEDVAAAPYFTEKSDEVLAFFNGCDVCGFNAVNFDVPLLWEELHRAGRAWNIEGMRIIDPGTIFKKKEERTLAAAMKFYCGRDLEGAHDARNDIEATVDVLGGQLNRYEDVKAMSIDELARFSSFDNRIDLAGKLVRNRDGDAIYNIGKAKGTRVLDDPGFGHWMMGKPFYTAQTKVVLSRILNNEA